MARPAFIEKLMQPAKWLFKKELIPLDDLAGNALKSSNGKLNVDFNEMPEAQFRQIVLSMIQANGGLAATSEGKMYVDFSQMGTDRFDAMIEEFRKSLKLPKYLTANLNIYVDVNHANASDTLDEGRGLTANKPFKSIYAAANYVAENYNVANYKIFIHVAAGSYGHFSCGEYSRVNGSIVVQGEGNVSVNNSDNPLGSTISINGGVWHLIDLKVKNSRDRMSQTATTVSVSAAINVQGGDCAVECCDIECELLNDLPSGARPAQINGILVNINGNCTYRAGAGTSFTGRTLNSADTSGINPFYVYGTLEFYATSDTSVSNTLTISNATYANFVCSNGGLVTVSAAWANQFKINATNCTGARYRVVNSGKINTNNLGPEFFPGSSAGYVESSTNSWYK